MTVMIRRATLADVPAITTLLARYVRELFAREWGGTPEALARDGFGHRFELMIATRDDACMGFAAWTAGYDLHHCVAGGEIIDMYVTPAVRGHGVALQLVAAVAAAVHASGGAYVAGQAAGDNQPLYERLAMTFAGAHCIVGGKAFRTLAELAGRSVRELVRGMPSRADNDEP